MPYFRVTYVETALRERIIQADSAPEAEDAVRNEFENAVHHHLLDGWNDDWQAQDISAEVVRTARPDCCECGT